jgi:hypothetical protein
MFKILLFTIAIEPIFLVLYVGLLQLKSGLILQSLPSFAISIMCFSYLFSGIKEAIDLIKVKLNKSNAD